MLYFHQSIKHGYTQENKQNTSDRSPSSRTGFQKKITQSSKKQYLSKVRAKLVERSGLTEKAALLVIVGPSVNGPSVVMSITCIVVNGSK